MSKLPQRPYDAPDFAPPALSEIIPDLFQGRRPETYVGYGIVVSCEEHLARKPMTGYAGVTVHLPLRDEDDFNIPEQAVWDIGAFVADFIAFGQKALVHCTGGLNRSSLVTAAALVASGWDRKMAVELIRAKHDKYALCNRAFERFVTGEILPTAETSAFRGEA